jgi:hypothetical protein
MSILGCLAKKGNWRGKNKKSPPLNKLEGKNLEKI